MNIGQFAFRNVLRNKRRSVITLGAIAMGFMAINLFGGYAAETFFGLQQIAIYGEGVGHLTIYKKGFLTDGKIEPKEYLITEEEQQRIRELVQKNPAITTLMPKLDVAGLISNGATSTIFIAQGARPDDEATLKAEYPYEGEGARIDKDAPIGVQVGSELAEMLDLKLQDLAVIMANTLDGQMNALDVEIRGIYNTGSNATDDKFMLMPLELCQSLYDTSAVDRLVLLIDDVSATESVREWLLKQLPEIGFDAEVKSWNELSMFYNQVKAMFSMIFLFIFSIVLVIVVTSVINTMMMSVVERTQEIGTLRALGLKRSKVMKLFGAEGALIGILGVITGIAGTLFVTWLVSVAHITYVPPNNSTEVVLAVHAAPPLLIVSSAFLIGLSFLAAVMPSFRASRLKIVDAFGHV